MEKINFRTPGLVLAVYLASCSPPGTSSFDMALPGNCALVSAGPRSYLECQGVFAAGGAAHLCPVGYALATVLDPALHTVCDLSAAEIQNNQFFAADSTSWGDPALPFTHTICSSSPGWLVGLGGCGFEKGSSAYYTNCSGWPHSNICTKSQYWTCPDGTLRTATNTNPSHGVICTKS